MLYCKKIMFPEKTIRQLVLVIMLLWWTPVMAFVVEQASSRLQDGAYFIDAAVNYEFTDTVIEALENGVPITVDIHFQVRRADAWIWEKDIVDMHRRRQLRYLPLSESYEVTDIDNKLIKLYFSRLAAIDALGAVKNVKVVDDSQLESGEIYLMEIRSTLDIESLPVPLRPRAYMSSDWKLSSEWSQWQIRP